MLVTWLWIEFASIFLLLLSLHSFSLFFVHFFPSSFHFIPLLRWYCINSFVFDFSSTTSSRCYNTTIYSIRFTTLLHITAVQCAVSGCYEFWRPKLLQLRLHCSNYLQRLKVYKLIKTEEEKTRRANAKVRVSYFRCVGKSKLAQQTKYSIERLWWEKRDEVFFSDNNRQEICNVFQMYKSNYRFDEYRMWFRWMDDVEREHCLWKFPFTGRRN